MTIPLLPRHLSKQLRTLRALALGLSIGYCTSALADNNLPEVQRLIKQGQYAQAMEKVDAYLSSRPKDAQGRFIKGLIFTEMNRPAEAIAIFTKLTEEYPELPEPYNNLAVLYAQQKQYEKARTALEMAIRTHPSYATAYENLGDIYARLASQAYDKALQLDSSNMVALNKLGLIRDLITTGKGNVKPSLPAASTAPAVPPVAAAPTKAAGGATAVVVATTAGVAGANVKAAEAKATPAATGTPAASTAPATALPATPAPSGASVANTSAASDEVAKALAGWASAWSRKDMKAYFAAYASDFEPPKGVSRKAWEEERKQRIAGKAGKISVDFDEPQISINGDRATAKFRQHYKAPGLTSSANKTLVFVRAGGKWLIKDENAH